MNMAVAALQPEGLPLALLPFWKIVHGFVLKTTYYNIVSFTTKFSMYLVLLLASRSFGKFSSRFDRQSHV
jgi:hypothetical protein